MTLRAFLVDDEPLALDRLELLLERTGRVEVVGRATEPEDAIARLAAAPPDVCFLDIEMPRLTGFDVLARLPVQPVVVFTTAYEHYALRAFAENSIDYLLKPVDPERLAQALDKIERLRGAGAGPPVLSELLAQVAASLREPAPAYAERIASRLGERVRFIDVADVTHFVAKDKLCFAVAAGKEHCIDQTLAALEARLDPRRFVRVHRSAIVRIAAIRHVRTPAGGGMTLQLNDATGTELTVARDRVKDVRAKLEC